MRNRLAAVLKVRPDEGRLVLLVALLFACLQAGQGLGDNAASALFLLRFGVDFLPYMYIAAGGLAFVITMAYSAGLGRFEKSRFFLWMMAAFAGLLIIERAAIGLSLPFLYPALWLTISAMGGVLGTFVWNLAGEVCDARQAKRLFPLFTSAGILGSVVGNAVTGAIASLLGTQNLLILYAALLGSAFYLTRLIARAYFRREQAATRPAGRRPSLSDDLRAGFDFVRSSPLMRLVAYSSILFSVLFFAIAYPFNKIVTASFPDEAGVAGFFGLFNSLTTAATFFVSLLLANRIYTRLGIINGVLLMPLTYIFCFAVFSSRYDLGGAAIARFLQVVILSGIAGTAWNALFNVVPWQKRSQVLAFNNGVPAQMGVMLSGVLLIVADQAFTVQQIFLAGTLIAVVCGILVWRMRAAYAQALVEALRLGRLEVFSASEAAFSGLQADVTALQVAGQALQDPKAATRRLAAEILGKMQAVSAIPALTSRLADPDGEVRASVIEALGVLGAETALEDILARLDDPQEQVRVQALSVIPQLAAKASPALVERLSGLIQDDPSSAVQMQAAAALAKLGFGERVLASLMLWLEDASPATRRAAALALAHLPGAGVSRALIAHLEDVDGSVRASAAEALRQQGDQSRSLVLELFEADHLAVDAALSALAPGSPEELAPLRAYARREITQVRALRSQLASLPSSSRALAFLCDRLQGLASVSEARLIKTIGLFGERQTMELVGKSIHAASSENRAAALEALDTVGEKQLAKSVVALLEEEPERSTPAAVIETLLGSPDPWARILAARSIPELGLRQLIPRLHECRSDPDPLLQEACDEALGQFGEIKPMDTLKTVSILERVLLLREIPIFADLPPEDLKLVADIAHEDWHPQDSVIFSQGDQGNVMFVIVEGQVQVVQTVGGVDQLIARRGPGDFVGEMAIIESAPRSATLRTQSDVRLLAIDGEIFKRILHERPDVSFAVLRSVSRRLREMTE